MNGRWRSWEDPDGDAAHNEHFMEFVQRAKTVMADTSEVRSRTQSETPSRPVLKNLIRDALSANPEGLRSEEVFHWLKANRPEALVRRDEESLRASVNSTLSTQSCKKEPAIWKYKDDHSKKSGYIWKLAATQDAEGRDESIEQGEHQILAGNTLQDTIASAVALPSSHPQDKHSSEAASGTYMKSFQSDGNHSHARSEERDTLPDASATEGLAHERDNDLSLAAADTVEPRSAGKVWGREYSAREEDGDVPIGTEAGLETIEIMHSSLVDQQIYFGKIIMRVQELSRQATDLRMNIDADRAGLANLGDLEHKADQMESKAQELEEAAREARIAANQAAFALQQERSKDIEIKRKEEEVSQISKELAEGRAKLNID